MNIYKRNTLGKTKMNNTKIKLNYFPVFFLIIFQIFWKKVIKQNFLQLNDLKQLVLSEMNALNNVPTVVKNPSNIFGIDGASEMRIAMMLRIDSGG